MKTFVLCFIAALMSGAVLSEDDGPAVKFDLNVKNDSLDSVLRILSEKSGYAILAAKVEDDALVTTLEVKQSTWREALDRIAKDKSFTLATNPTWGKLILLERAERLSLNFKETDAREALNTWALAFNRNLIVLPDVQGKVTLTLKDIPATEALAKIAAEAKCEIIHAPFKMSIVLGEGSAKKLTAARAAERAYVFGTQATPAINSGKSVSLKQQNQSVGGLLQELREQNIEFEAFGKVGDPRQKVSIDVKNLTARGAVELIARRYGVGVDDERNGPPAIYFSETSNMASCVFILADIGDILYTISTQSDANVMLNADVLGRLTLLRNENIPAETLIRMVANPLGIAVVRDPENIIRCVGAETLMKECGPVAQGLRISFEHNRTPLGDVVAAIAKSANADIKFAEGLKPGEILFSGILRSVHWKQALIAILKLHKLSLTEQADGKFVISPPHEARKP